ncbi:MAG: hypothetical protein ACP5HS_12590, partial [Anaerolineae bacterium]
MLNGSRSLRRCGVCALLGLLVVFVVLLAGCGRDWTAIVVAPDASEFVVDAGIIESLNDFVDEQRGLPLERVLWTAGHYVIDQVTLTDPEGVRHTFDWNANAEDAWWQKNGRVVIGGERLAVARMQVDPPALLSRFEAGIIDLAPTAAAALGLPAPAQASGTALEAPSADHVLLLFLDGFGY